MSRICGSLAHEGYRVTLVGIRGKAPSVDKPLPYRQIRLKMWFRKGKPFYLEYQVRLGLFLLFQPMDAVCAVDLDSILPCLLVSILRRVPRIYDAHEWFSEMQEVVSRPWIRACWKAVERFAVPRFRLGYTVSSPISQAFRVRYGREYPVIRNLPLPEGVPDPPDSGRNRNFVLYQGAVNVGRSFDTLIPAMRDVRMPLVICGDGNYMQQARNLVRKYGLEEKVRFTGLLPPGELREYTRQAKIGLTLFERSGKSNYYSLANRFFDYIQEGLPQLCVDYPAYREINDAYQVAVLLDDLHPLRIAEELNNLIDNDVLYQTLASNCLRARQKLNWREEETKLIRFYQNLFADQ